MWLLKYWQRMLWLIPDQHVKWFNDRWNVDASLLWLDWSCSSCSTTKFCTTWGCLKPRISRIYRCLLWFITSFRKMPTTTLMTIILYIWWKWHRVSGSWQTHCISYSVTEWRLLHYTSQSSSQLEIELTHKLNYKSNANRLSRLIEKHKPFLCKV